MPQIPSLRLLLSSAHATSSPLLLSPLKPSSLSPLFFNPRNPRTLRRFSLFTVVSSYSKRQRKQSRPPNLTRRHKSSLSEKGLAMEESESSFGFNRKRAEGRDKDEPKRNLQLKVRKLNPVNTICYVQILGTGMDTQDTSPSVLLFFDKQRFIFNAGEGLQRFCTEHKIKLSKIDRIFLSRVCSETAGGLPGLLLTLAGMGEEGMSVNISGPSDLKYLVEAMKSFIPNAAMVHTSSFGPSISPHGIDPRKFTDPITLIDDEVVKISAILLRPSCKEGSELMKEEPTLLDGLNLGVDERRDKFSDPLLPHSDAEIQLKPGDISVIYVCELPEIKGKFDPKKAMALGLKPGPKYRELQLGNSVKSDRQNGMVHPGDVMGPSVPGPIVLLVDCPTPSHLGDLLSLHSLGCYYTDNSLNPVESSKTVNCIIHLSPSSVISTTEYQKWMTRFGGAQHIMAGHQLKNLEVPILKASARIAARLNYLCPQFFPAPGFWSLQQSDCSATEASKLHEGTASGLSQCMSAENLLKFHLRPYSQLGLDRSSIPNSTTPSGVIEELVSEIPEIVEAAHQVSSLWHGGREAEKELTPMQYKDAMIEEPWLTESSLPSCLEDVGREDMEIVLLGTGSSQPSKYRNVSSVFINLFSKGGLLFDCGEGTLGQLKRRFGVKGADDAVKGLRCIWISHIHADHHTGLARILALRRDLLKETPHEPLLVIGPRQLKRFLDAYHKLEDLDMEFLDCRNTTEASWSSFESAENQAPLENASSFENINHGNPSDQMNQNVDYTLFARGSQMQSYWKRPASPVVDGMAFFGLKNLKKVLKEAGLEDLKSYPVIHCPQAFGVALRAGDRINRVGKVIPGWKIVYSGDTRPCTELIEASHGATVLIHEATFEDAMVEEARARNHSTTEEAIGVADAAGVYRTILTHFSQRYPKIPVFGETHMHKTCIAFDMMSVNLADLHVLPRVLPYLKLLFKNEMIVDEADDVETAASEAT